MKKISPADVYNFDDPHYPGEFPDETKSHADDLSNPLELRKLFSMNFPELQDLSRIVHDKESGDFVDDYEDLMKKYFR